MSKMYERIEQLCKNRNITIGGMCTEVGIPRSRLTDLKMGRSKSLRYEALQKIAAFFGVTVPYLVYGVENVPTPENLFVGANKNMMHSIGGIRQVVDAEIINAVNSDFNSIHISTQDIPTPKPTRVEKFCDSEEGRYTIDLIARLSFAARRKVLDLAEQLLAAELGVVE